MKILGIYKIVYNNGFEQTKNLISHTDYIEIIKPISSIAANLELSKSTRNEAKVLKKLLKNMFGDEWFTDNSPLFESIKTGILSLPKHQGGDHKIKVTKTK